MLTGQFPGQATQYPWIVNSVTVAVRVEFLQAHVDADHSTGIPAKQGIHIHFHAQGDVVFPRRSAGHGGIQDPAVEVLGEFGFHFPNFRELDSVANDTDAIRLVSRSIGLAVDMLGLETGVFRPLLEEILVGSFEVLQGFLQSHAVRFVQPHIFPLALHFRQQRTGLGICDRFFVLCPFVTAQRQEAIVHETAATQNSLDSVLLFLIWIDSELEAFRVCSHFLTSFARSSGFLYTV